MEFGKRLREIRLERNMTQQAVADAVRIELRTYQRYEQGSREPSFATLLLLANVLNISTDYLLGRTEK